MIKQNFLLGLNRITLWTLFILVVLGGGAVVFMCGIILTHMIASGLY